MNILSTVSAILRGLSFDGNSGLLVAHAAVDKDANIDGPDILRIERLNTMVTESAFEAARATGEKDLSLTGSRSVGKELQLEIMQQVRSAWNGYVTSAGGEPRRVFVRFSNGDAYLFGLGRTVDEARNLASAGERSGNADRRRNDDATIEDDDLTLDQLFVKRSSVVAGRVSVVTGGAQGFGEGVVRALAAGGSVVCIADLNVEGARKLSEELNKRHGRTVALAYGGDVTDERSVEQMVDAIVADVGGVDLLVSNAGVLKAGSVVEMSLKDFSFVTSVNYTGFFICTKCFAPVMALQNLGSGGKYFSDIVQINSKSGLEGSNKNGAYAGSKFGGIGLVQSFAMELVANNIKVNAVCPGNFFEGPLWSDPERGLFVQYLRTGKVPGAKTVADVKKFYEEKVPMRRGCRPEDVVRAICYIVEQQYETGQAVPVTGGQVMLS